MDADKLLRDIEILSDHAITKHMEVSDSKDPRAVQLMDLWVAGFNTAKESIVLLIEGSRAES